jgi:hypothetical protein
MLVELACAGARRRARAERVDQSATRSNRRASAQASQPAATGLPLFDGVFVGADLPGRRRCEDRVATDRFNPAGRCGRSIVNGWEIARFLSSGPPNSRGSANPAERVDAGCSIRSSTALAPASCASRRAALRAA